MSDQKVMLSCKDVSIRYMVGDFKAVEAAAELARLRTDSAKLAEVRRILKGGGK